LKIITVLVLLFLLTTTFGAESIDFGFPQIKLYQVDNPSGTIVGPNLYIQTNTFDINMGEIVSTTSDVLSEDDPIDLGMDAVICAGNVNMDVDLDENTQTEQIYLGMSANVVLNGIEGGVCSCCAPAGETNDLKVVFNEDLINRYHTIAPGTCNADVYPVSSGCFYTSFNNFLNPLTNTKFYPKLNEELNYPESGINISLVCDGNLEINIDESLFYSGPIEDYTGSFSVTDIGTHTIDINLTDVDCLYFTKRHLDGTACPNDLDSVITKYCLTSEGGTNCNTDELLSFSPPETLHYQFIVDNPQILVDSTFVTDIEGTPGIVINPGESKEIIIHLLLEENSMEFNITNITSTTVGFNFTPDTPFNIFVPAVSAGPPPLYEFLIPGVLTAPPTYDPLLDEVNLILHFETDLPVCNDPITSFPAITHITQGPDLIVNLSSGGATGIIYQTEGATTTIDVDTQNTGSLNTDNESTTYVTSDDLTLFTDLEFLIPDLDPGANQINSFDFTCPPGINMNITFEACADYYDNIIEVNEDDNCDNITIICEAYPNLQVEFANSGCIVNETQSVDITTYSNGICSKNASWTQVILKKDGGSILNTTKYSVPPMPNLWNPNSFIFIPQREPDTTTPFGNNWGTCTDLVNAVGETYTNIIHSYSYEVTELGRYTIIYCADIDNEIFESNEGDNCKRIRLNCVPPAPANLTPFCTNLEINQSEEGRGLWGVINEGVYDTNYTLIPTYSGSISPSPSFPSEINDLLRAGDTFSKNAKWRCGDNSSLTTYTIFVNWTDQGTGAQMNDSATCTVECGIVWFCEDYL